MYFGVRPLKVSMIQIIVLLRVCTLWDKLVLANTVHNNHIVSTSTLFFVFQKYVVIQAAVYVRHNLP